MYETSVLIAGAGPTGLTLAIDLARRRIPFRLIDAAPRPFEGSRGKGLQPRTLEIFEDLGVIHAILAAGALYPKFRAHFGPFSIRAGSLGSAKKPTGSVPYPNLWMVPQSRTEAILRHRLGALAGAPEFGHALAAFSQDHRGVTATLSTGEEVHARFLVGCDGAHSVVRKTLGIAMQGESIEPAPSLVADVHVEGLHRRDWHIWPFAKGGPIALCPLPGTDLFQLTSKAALAEPDIPNAVYRATGYRVQGVQWSSTFQPPSAWSTASRWLRLPRRRRRPCAPPGRRAGTQHRCTGRVQPRLETRPRPPRRARFAPRYLRSRTSPHRRGRTRAHPAAARNPHHQARRCHQSTRPPLPPKPPVQRRDAWFPAPRRPHAG